MSDTWRQKSMDELILLSEGEASRFFIDSRNARVLFRLINLFAIWAVIEAAVSMSNGEPIQAVRSVLTLILVYALKSLRDHPFLAKNFRPIFLGYLAIQLLLLRQLDFDPGAPVQVQDFLLPLVLLFFRLPADLAAFPLGALWLAASGRKILAAIATDLPLGFWQIVGQSAITVVVMLWVARATRKIQEQFLETWRREHRRHRERLRMREELDDARKIQLSMLPRKDPDVPWLDVAGISIPASEVGGDYYDYFRVSPLQQSITIADVAGHGVSSALLLSGIRSCLYLLHEKPQGPAEMLTQLDRMVRQTTGSRLFVTLLYAIFDYQRKELTFSAAGHPPLVCYRAKTRTVEEIGLQALPLGTPLGNKLRELTVPFSPNDIFLFTTDGLAETLNDKQDLYGNQRLIERLRDTAHDRSAKEIRDTLLGDVWNFKGDGQQTDDITIVVVKVH